MFIHSKKYLCVFKSSLVIFHVTWNGFWKHPWSTQLQLYRARKTDPVCFRVNFTWIYFSVFEICSLKAISDSSLSSAKSKQAIRIIQLHHGSYFLFPSISSMTGWQPVPNAGFHKDNHKLPREGKEVASWHIIFHLS